MLHPGSEHRAHQAGRGGVDDVYITDLPPSALQPGADLSNVSGSILHLSLFLRPKAGKTPIETTASTATVRLIVIAQGHVGVYGGGGFLQPLGKPGRSTFSGKMKLASLRLLRQTPGFLDALGPAQISVTFSAPPDEDLARQLQQRIDEIISVAEPIAEAPKPGP